MTFTVEVVGTGSDGNALLIDNHVLIDFGLPWKKLEPAARKAGRIFISHRHGDHTHLAALRSLLKNRPAAVTHGLYVNRDTYDHIAEHAPAVAARIPDAHIIGPDSHIDWTWRKTDWSMSTYPLIHDVENQGFILTNHTTGETLLHATDTVSMVHAPSGPFDMLLVEGNWDEDRMDEALGAESYHEVLRATRNLRHLSVQAMEKFVRTHSHADTRVIQLHESMELGSRSGLNSRKVTVDALRQPLVRTDD